MQIFLRELGQFFIIFIAIYPFFGLLIGWAYFFFSRSYCER